MPTQGELGANWGQLRGLVAQNCYKTPAKVRILESRDGLLAQNAYKTPAKVRTLGTLGSRAGLVLDARMDDFPYFWHVNLKVKKIGKSSIRGSKSKANRRSEDRICREIVEFENPRIDDFPYFSILESMISLTLGM